MGIEAVGAVLKHSKLSGTALSVMLGIAYHTNRENKAWPSVNTLAEYCNVSRQSVHNGLNAAKEAGELVINYKAGHNGCNIYELNLPEFYPKHSQETVKPALQSEPTAQSSQLDSQASLTVKPALRRQSSQLDSTVKPALPEPLITTKNHNNGKADAGASLAEKPKTILRNEFIRLTGIPNPTRKSDDRFWWSSIAEIYNIANQDITRGKQLIKDSVKELKSNNLSIVGPNSLVNTCRKLAAKKRHTSIVADDGGVYV